MLKQLIFIFVFLASVNCVLGCSLAIEPYSKFDSTEYIFIGEVVEIDLVKYTRWAREEVAAVLKIKVSENIYSPRKSAYYKILPLRISPDCSLWSDIKEVSEAFPVGSQVRVAAKETKIFKNLLRDSDTLLEVSIYNKGVIDRNDLDKRFRTSSKSLYNYGSLFNRRNTTSTDYASIIAEHNLLNFELRKDLVRLEKAKLVSRKMNVLQRLSLNPYIGFPVIATHYVEERAKVEALIKIWQRRHQNFFPKNSNVQ